MPSGVEVKVTEGSGEVEVVVEVDPRGSPIDIARRLAGNIVFQTQTVAQHFNKLAERLSPVKKGRFQDHDVTLENAMEVKATWGAKARGRGSRG